MSQHQQQPAQAFASHLIAQTLSSVALLESLNLISSADASDIRSKLPNPYTTFPSLAMPTSTPSASTSDLSAGMGSMQLSAPPNRMGGGAVAGPSSPESSIGMGLGGVGMNGMNGSQMSLPALPPRGPRESRARALWDYHGQEQDDLVFRKGDIIIIDQEVNEQWYRGRVIPQGQMQPLDRSGLFPSNYVEKLHPGSFQPPPPIGPQAMVPYQQEQNQSMVAMQPVPTQQMVQQPQLPVQDPNKHGKMGKYGSQLAGAAVNGAGFGFGASIASNIVNAIL